ncbi:MAG: SPOR domain-containing protein [Rhodothermales bacterium]
MIQYSAILTGLALFTMLMARPELLVQPIASTPQAAQYVQDDTPIGDLAKTPVGEPVSISGVLMSVDRETEDAVLLTFADSSGSVVVPYLDTEARDRIFEVGTVYHVVGMVVGKGDKLFLVPRQRDDVVQVQRSPSELLARKAAAIPVASAGSSNATGTRATSTRQQDASPRKGYYVVLASPPTRSEADQKLAAYSGVAQGKLSVVQTRVNAETRYRVVVGPYTTNALAKGELGRWSGVVEGAWITRM